MFLPAFIPGCCSKYTEPQFLLQSSQVQLNLLQQETLHRHCLEMAAGRGTQRAALDQYTAALGCPGALQEKTSNC